MLILFVVLIVGPIIASKFISLSFTIPMNLAQQTGLDNNNTVSSMTGLAAHSASETAAASRSKASASSAATGGARFLARDFLEYAY